ncbi:uncharacterized protein LOC100901212 [Galendromus occidentalis]|uniref:Nuclear pore complex protein Nup153 n=1 Tax=Galendromus occidentalis TaxID=34638 RepID=A0AAJ7PAH4_9ACAR|nr:uncharacterized protein LOC100901212 [Galendromus occidentalis]
MSKKRLEVDAQVKKLLASCKSEEERIHRYLRIAQQYLYIDEHCEAEKYLLRYIKAKPDSHEAHKLVGELYLKLRRFQDAYDSLKRSYELSENKEVLANICEAAPLASIALSVKKGWLKAAEEANIPQMSMLGLREAVLREGEFSVLEMEAVLKERSILYPLEPEAQIKLLVFYAEANRFEDCVRIILREESKQELRNSPQWYRACQNALNKLRSSKAMPYDQTLALLHLHISQRLTMGLITDPFFIADQDKGSVGLEAFFKQLEVFDNLLDEALSNQQWYRECLWSFVLDHFTGQLLFLFALGMLRRADESNREDAYRARGQALMFCALEYKPKKLTNETWFSKLKDDVRKLLLQVHLDGSYRTTVCYYCLANTSTDPSLAESVKIALSGNSAVKFVTERLFPGKAIAAVFNQTVLARACTKLPDRSVIAPYESNSCIAFAGSLEHIVWLLLSGAEMPTEKIFPSLLLVPSTMDGAHTPSQSDIDAFLAAVLAAVRLFGSKLDIIRPTVPREILHRAFTTNKQQNFWNAMYRTFVKKVNAGRDLIQPKKVVSDGLDIVRGKDAKKSMPVYYLIQIARDLHEKGRKKAPYFGAAVNYYRIVLARLDEQHRIQPAIGGGRAAPSVLFEIPKTMAASEDAGGYRGEANLEIGKFLLYSGQLERARSTLESVHNPKGYLYYARAAGKLCDELMSEGDVDTIERLLEKSSALLKKGLQMAQSDPELSEKLKKELESLKFKASETTSCLDVELNVSGLNTRETTSLPEVDMNKIDTLIKEQTAKILVDSTQKSAKLETELTELKAMQAKLIETLAQVLAEQTIISSQTKAAVATNSEMVIKVAQISQQLTRIEEQVSLSQTSADYTDYQDTSSSSRTQQYQSGGLVIPPGAGLPQFNLTGVQHPSAQTSFAAAAPTKPQSAVVTPKDDFSKNKILFEAEGTIYESRAGVSYSAVSGVHKIVILQTPNKGPILNSLWYFDAQRVYISHDLGRMTFSTYDTGDGQTNVQWTHGDKSYYIRFTDWSIQPGEILMRVFQDCGVPQEPCQPAKENIFLAAALNKTPTKSLASTTSPRPDVAVETPKSSIFSSLAMTTPNTTSVPLATPVAVSSSPGILPTPAAPSVSPANASSPFALGFGKSSPFTSVTGKAAVAAPAAAPVSTFGQTPSLGGFTFNSTPVVAANTVPAPTEVKAAEKSKTEEEPNPFSGFSFQFPKPEAPQPTLGSGWPLTTSSSAASTTPTSKVFSFSALTPTVSTVASSPSNPAAGVEGGDAEGEDYECTAQFKPVIELPQLVDAKTGEEDEDAKFCDRAKLYRFDQQTREWKERGLGEVKILRNKTTGKYRVLMRREQVLKICANHPILPGMELKPRPKPTEHLWFAPDFADGEQKYEQFVIRFKTKEQAEKFKEVFDEGVKAASDSTSVETSPSAKIPSIPVKEEASQGKPLPSLSEMFKVAAGSWSCSTCLVNNKADASTCISCGTSKSGAASQDTASSAPAVSSPFKFGVPVAAKDNAPPAVPSFGDFFKPDPKNWECSSCYVSNPPTAESCQACSAARAFKFGLPKTSSFGFSTSNPDTTQASKAPISTTYTFGTSANSSSAPQPATGFVFGNTVASTQAPAASTTPTAPVSVKKEVEDQTPPAAELSAGFTFGSPQQHKFSFEASGVRHSEDDDDQVVESQDRDFAPAVASLPPEVEVVTGEEGQTCLYSVRAKLYRFANKEWKERGVGDFKILQDPNTSKVRLTMRREQVHKVCLNHYLTKQINFSKRDDRTLEWQALDFAEGEPEPTLFAIRVRNRETASAMLDAILDAQGKQAPTPVKASPKSASPSVETTPKQKTASPLKPQVLFSDSTDAQESSASIRSDSVEVVKIERACDADVMRARALMLPDHFFLYEGRQHKCKGCRGCEQEEANEACAATPPVKPEEQAAVKPKKVAQKKSPQPAEKSAPAETSAPALQGLAAVKIESQTTKTPPKAPPVFGAPPAFGTVPVEKTQKETLKPLEPSETTTDSGFLFGAGSSMTFSALAAKGSTTGFAKSGGDNPPWGGGQVSSFFSSFSKTGATSSPGKNDDSTQDVEEVEPSKDIHFEPVIPLPDLVAVQTGEEQDQVLYSQRAKLYVYHGETSEWKERALGEAKILRCTDGRARIVVRRDMVHKVACNHYITDGMELKPLSTSNNSLTWSAVDFAEGDPTPQLFALKVKTEARLNEFKEIFDQEVEKARKAKEGLDQTDDGDAAGGNGDDLEDFEIVKCGPEGVATTREDAKEDYEEEVYEYDETAEEDDEYEEGEHDFDEDNVLFSAVVDITEEMPIGGNKWLDLGQGIVRIVYDDDIFGHVIYLSDAATDTIIAKTIIAVQTSLRETGRKAIWMAQDVKQEPLLRRRFSIEFCTDDDLKNFSVVFNEGKDTALKCGILENSDQPPWTSPAAP